MGPILPQINVFGKQLGISPDAMGFVTAVLPFIYMPAKPLVGYLIDYFPVCKQNTPFDYYIIFVYRVFICRMRGRRFSCQSSC